MQNIFTEISPSYFFDLSSFQHSNIFSNVELVWQVLPKIEDYLKTLCLGDISVDVPQGTFLENRHLITIGKGTVIEAGAYIKGPCFIGENCTIRHGAYIRGNLITGNRCIIGHDTEIKNSILLDDAHAAHFAYLGDSVLGNHVNLGAGVVCANLKLNRGLVNVYYKGTRFATGLKKFGAIIGDSAQLGCNSVTNPGTLVGKESGCYPCSNIGGFIPANSMAKPDIKIVVSPFSSSKV